MTPQTFAFANSSYWPIAIGFFGLGTGYFIWGGQALFGYPKTGPEVDRTMGMWGFWMPGAGGRQRSHSRDDRPLAQRGNTIQHNSPDGASRRSSPEEIVVSVTDSGLGLPPQQTEQIFNAFFTTKPHGTGMGLRISRSIIESHGGRLWAADNSPRGASFCFTLPTKAEGA